MKANCKHKNAYFFHENAPAYCPNCDRYIDGKEPIGRTTRTKTNRREQQTNEQ